MPRDPEKYKNYQAAYYIQRRAKQDQTQSRIKELEAQVAEYETESMVFCKKILRIINNPTMEKLMDKFVILHSEPTDTWTEREKVKWYRDLCLYLLASRV